MDANGGVIANPVGMLPLPTTDDEGNPVDLQQYGAWSMYNRSLDIVTEDASYIYLSEIDLNYPAATQVARQRLGEGHQHIRKNGEPRPHLECQFKGLPPRIPAG